MINELFNYGSMPTLERMVQFTGARHAVITDNIANLNTPHFRPTDLDVEGFQAQLGNAIDRRRAGRDPVNGELPLRSTRRLGFTRDAVHARPEAQGEHVLYHDRNDRDLERQMQDLVENAMVHNAALQMLKSRFDLLETAIRERV